MASLDNSSNPNPIWSLRKKIIVGGILGLFIVIFILLKLIFGTAAEAIDHTKYVKSIAYNVKTEYTYFVPIASVRGSITDNPILHHTFDPILKSLQTPFYNSALEKIPSNDGERAFWQYYYEIAPEWLQEKEDTEELIAKIIDVITALKHGIKNKEIRDVESYFILQNLAISYVEISGESFVQTKWKDQFRAALIPVGIKKLKEIKTDLFIKEGNEFQKNIPLKLALYISAVIQDEYKKTPQSICRKLTSQDIDFLITADLQMLQAYKTINSTETNAAKSLLYNGIESLKNLKDNLEQNCN